MSTPTCSWLRHLNERTVASGCALGTNFRALRCVKLSFPMANQPKTLAQKLWDAHVVRTAEGEPDLLFVDLHLVHEVTSPQAFEGLRIAGRRVRRPDLTVATMDHNVPTRGGVRAADELSRKPMEVLAEHCGPTLRGLSMEGRMTVCNMSIEWGAKAGMVAPDETTFAYVEGRPHAPKGAAWEKALDLWRKLATDDGARFDGEIDLDASTLEPHVTWGTTPAQVVPVTGRVPAPRSETDERALRYMDLKPGVALADIAIDRVFIGSCTNARPEDLRAAASVIQGRRVHPKARW